MGLAYLWNDRETRVADTEGPGGKARSGRALWPTEVTVAPSETRRHQRMLSRGVR